jgi:hypothetical protein
VRYSVNITFELDCPSVYEDDLLSEIEFDLKSVAPDPLHYTNTDMGNKHEVVVGDWTVHEAEYD